MTLPKYFFVFDVESIGLHGEGFAVAYLIITPQGEKVHEAVAWFDPAKAKGTDSNRIWIKEHVTGLPEGYGKMESPTGLRDLFWQAWMHWKSQGAVMVADCCWPVEARFLIACVDDDPERREWDGPYPLHDLGSIMLALGHDPLSRSERQAGEIPEHNPLCDARQSARLLVEILAKQP